MAALIARPRAKAKSILPAQIHAAVAFRAGFSERPRPENAERKRQPALSSGSLRKIVKLSPGVSPARAKTPEDSTLSEPLFVSTNLETDGDSPAMENLA